jgi:formylglycine-generating enzyme required for sulfatase activity
MKTYASRYLLPLCLAACLGGCFSPPENVRNTVGMEFVYIAKGDFIMGCGETDNECLSDQRPQHPVILSSPFFLGKHPVTQEQWTAVMGSNPSIHKGNKHPVENVSWHDAQEFIRRLNAREGTDRYRLPTEAEWEYAARAGMSTKFPFDPASAVKHAWFWDNAGGRSQPVGQKEPNPWGLHDMLGNVWEWVQDWYGEHWYEATLESYINAPSGSKPKTMLPSFKGATATDPKGPAEGTARVLRGGSWGNDLRYLRAAHRNAKAPDYKYSNTGFRLLVVPDSSWVSRMEAAQRKAGQEAETQLRKAPPKGGTQPQLPPPAADPALPLPQKAIEAPPTPPADINAHNLPSWPGGRWQ